jgi:hypothetical protein
VTGSPDKTRCPPTDTLVRFCGSLPPLLPVRSGAERFLPAPCVPERTATSLEEDLFQSYPVVVRCRKRTLVARSPQTILSIVGDSKDHSSRFAFFITRVVVVFVLELVHKDLMSVSVLLLSCVGGEPHALVLSLLRTDTPHI